MDPVQLREAWRKRPFQPFRNVLSNGSNYVITKPDCMMVTNTTTAIAIPCDSHGDQLRSFC